MRRAGTRTIISAASLVVLSIWGCGKDKEERNVVRTGGDALLLSVSVFGTN